MRTVFLMMLVAVVGCSTNKSAPTTPTTHDEERESTLKTATAYRAGEMRYDNGVANALVFDPPIIADEQPLYLARADRALTAFGGFEEVTTTYSYLRIDDRQTGDGRERYERRSIVERVGVSRR